MTSGEVHIGLLLFFAMLYPTESYGPLPDVLTGAELAIKEFLCENHMPFLIFVQLD